VLGCRERDPFEGTVALPARIDDVRTSVLSVRGVPAGIEERTTGRDGERRVIVRRRTWSFVIDGEAETVRTATRTEHDGSHVVSWTDGEHTWSGAAFVPDLFPPPSSGTWPVLDATGTVAETWVDVEGNDIAWTIGSVPARATFADGGLARATVGALTLAPASPGLTIAPIDPAAALSVPLGDIDAPARPVVARFRVGGEVVDVNAPLPVELRSSDIMLLAELIARAGGGDCEARSARFVELATEHGIDARVVAGLALDGERRRLVPHAWSEVRLYDRWVAVDPTWRLLPADAARLTLGVASRAEVAAALLALPPVEVVSLR